MIPVAPHFANNDSLDLTYNNLERVIMYSEWCSREALDELRVIPYGIPNEIYYGMIRNQFHPIGKGTLFPEHRKFTR